ncbi:MAG: hypothetical protein QNK37_13715 [Acidobacteriota bacterium]|nr:hypothetical protein [Acidobacteriota bacterium]
MSNIERYLGFMEEVKCRIHVVQSFYQKEWSAIYRITTIESLCLQIRKILESIALGSLVLNKEQFEKHGVKFHKFYHASRILRDIEGLNPEFYPVPIIEEPSKEFKSSL